MTMPANVWPEFGFRRRAALRALRLMLIDPFCISLCAQLLSHIVGVYNFDIDPGIECASQPFLHQSSNFAYPYRQRPPNPSHLAYAVFLRLFVRKLLRVVGFKAVTSRRTTQRVSM